MAAVLAFLKISATFPVTRFISQFQAVKQQFTRTQEHKLSRTFERDAAKHNKERAEAGTQSASSSIRFDHFFKIKYSVDVRGNDS